MFKFLKFLAISHQTEMISKFERLGVHIFKARRSLRATTCNGNCRAAQAHLPQAHLKLCTVSCNLKCYSTHDRLQSHYDFKKILLTRFKTTQKCFIFKQNIAQVMIKLFNQSSAILQNRKIERLFSRKVRLNLW